MSITTRFASEEFVINKANEVNPFDGIEKLAEYGATITETNGYYNIYLNKDFHSPDKLIKLTEGTYKFYFSSTNGSSTQFCTSNVYGDGFALLTIINTMFDKSPNYSRDMYYMYINFVDGNSAVTAFNSEGNFLGKDTIYKVDSSNLISQLNNMSKITSYTPSSSYDFTTLDDVEEIGIQVLNIVLSWLTIDGLKNLTLKSPDGTKFGITIDNDGVLTISGVDANSTVSTLDMTTYFRRNEENE